MYRFAHGLCGNVAIMKKWKASYTVEAALIMPIILFAMFQGLVIGIDLHEQVKKATLRSEKTEEINAIEMIQNIDHLENLIDTLFEE